jgi:hypothetical protein
MTRAIFYFLLTMGKTIEPDNAFLAQETYLVNVWGTLYP